METLFVISGGWECCYNFRSSSYHCCCFFSCLFFFFTSVTTDLFVLFVLLLLFYYYYCYFFYLSSELCIVHLYIITMDVVIVLCMLLFVKQNKILFKKRMKNSIIANFPLASERKVEDQTLTAATVGPWSKALNLLLLFGHGTAAAHCL